MATAESLSERRSSIFPPSFFRDASALCARFEKKDLLVKSVVLESFILIGENEAPRRNEVNKVEERRKNRRLGGV